MTFAIVTLTLLFVVQQLAFNLHSITDGSPGLDAALAELRIANYDRPVLPRDARRCSLGARRSAGSCSGASSA